MNQSRAWRVGSFVVMAALIAACSSRSPRPDTSATPPPVPSGIEPIGQVTWTTAAMPDGSTGWTSAALTSSDDGLDWSVRQLFKGVDILSVAADGAHIIATTDQSMILVSRDTGTTWTQVPASDAGFGTGSPSVVAVLANGRWVALGTTGAVSGRMDIGRRPDMGRCNHRGG